MSRNAMFRTAPLAGLGALLLVAGCAEQRAAAPATNTGVFAADLRGGSAQCVVPETLGLTAGQTASATMQTVNDRGWCGVYVAQPGPQPYRLGLLTTRASNGRVFIHTVGNRTRIDYTPDPGFSGNDTFAVKLVPGMATLQVAVTVAPGATPVAATPPAGRR